MSFIYKHSFFNVLPIFEMYFVQFPFLIWTARDLCSGQICRAFPSLFVRPRIRCRDRCTANHSLIQAKYTVVSYSDSKWYCHNIKSNFFTEKAQPTTSLTPSAQWKSSQQSKNWSKTKQLQPFRRHWLELELLRETPRELRNSEEIQPEYNYLIEENNNILINKDHIFYIFSDLKCELRSKLEIKLKKKLNIPENISQISLHEIGNNRSISILNFSDQIQYKWPKKSFN